MRPAPPPLALALALAAAAPACAGAGDDDDGGAGTTTMLIDHAAWEPVAAADDPFAGRPAVVSCPAGDGYRVEDFGGEPSLDVYTAACDWLSLAQPLPAALPAGATVKLRLWHFELTAPEPATTRLGVAIAGEVLWSTEIAIPAPGALVLETWPLARALPAGAPIVFHVDNHGANAYALLEISATH